LKAALFYGPKDIRIQEIEPPTLEKGEILVKVEVALTGGTDLKTYLQGHPKIIKKIPSLFGYEFSGLISSLGPEVPVSWKIGDRVVSANTAPCFDCFFCKKEEYSLCENLEFLNGSFAEFIKVPAYIVQHNLYKIPDTLSFMEAASVQTLAVALHGFRRSEIKANDFLLVYGLGPIGQCFIKLAKFYFPQLKIIALGRSKSKLALAEENGAKFFINVENKSIKEIEEELLCISPYKADIVIEAVGKPETWSNALKLVRSGGLVNFFGGCPKGTEISLDTYQTHYQELRTIGVFHHSPSFMKEAFGLISTRKIDMKNLITEEMKLEDLEKALLKMKNSESMKIAISMRPT
jgi:L-iditol 2-dehydrogenase